MPKGWPEDMEDGSFYDYLKANWEISFFYKGHDYAIDRGGDTTKVDGYILIDRDDDFKVLHYEPTLEDFMEKGFMGQPMQPIIDESYIHMVH